MRKKRLVLLGGSHYLLPVIKAAHAHDCHVITMDYLPSNIAHRYSDEYVNVSIVDKEAVLDACRALKADGIMSFATDPGVVSAAYTAEHLELPFQCSYEAACILQDKGLFRAFLREHGFNCPRAKRYVSAKAPFFDLDFFTWPVIVKPVDSAGSKGVTEVDDPAGLAAAIDAALQVSIGGVFIVEEFLALKGFHSDTDLFSTDGKLKFITYSDQSFDPKAPNPLVPVQLTWPSSMTISDQEQLTAQTQMLFDLLAMRTGIYNIETCIRADGTPCLMEVSPRGGGDQIAEIQKRAFGVDLIDAEVRKAISLPVDVPAVGTCDGFWCEAVIYADSDRSGILKSIEFDKDISEKHIKFVDFQVSRGDTVRPFTGANRSLGDIFLRFESRQELDNVMSHKHDWLHINLEE